MSDDNTKDNLLNLAIHSKQRARTASEHNAERKRVGTQHAIQELIKEMPRGTHLTAPEVYRTARERGLQVSLSTIYRTLNLLQAHGDITALSSDHGRRFEARDDD